MNKITKKICLVLILAIAGIASASAQRIYASELKSVATASGYDLTFTLNAAATNVDVIINSTTSTDSFVIPFGAKPIGVNTVSVSSASAPNITTGAYTWEVKATGAAITAAANGDKWVKFTDETQNLLLNFYTAHGLAVDKSFESPYLGRLYVSSNYKTGTGGNGRTTSQGMYILDAALTDVTGQGDVPWTGGVSWFSGSFMSPERVQVGTDGLVYIGDAANGGVYIMNPGQYDGTYTQIFGGTATSGMYQDGSTTIGGLNYGLCISGAADSLQMVTCDRYYGTGASSNPWSLIGGQYNILSYDLGTSIPWTSDPSGVVLDAGAALNGGLSGAILNSSLLGNASGGINIVSDDRGGFFIAQNRNHNTYDATGANTSDAQNLPCLIHVSYTPAEFGNPASYEMDFNSGDPQWGIMGFMNGSNQTGMAVIDGGSTLIFGHTSTEYQIYNVDYSSGVPVLTLTDSINTPQTVGSAYSMDVDAAGNLYVLTTATTLAGYAPVTTDNTFTTPAPSSQVLNFIATGIVTPKAPQLQVYPNPVQDMAHISGVAGIESVKLIDLSGRVVMNQKQTSADIDMSGVAAGTYILFVNNTPVKITKK